MNFTEDFVFVILLAIGIVVLQIIIIYPLMFIVVFLYATGKIVVNAYQHYGWKFAGKIEYIYLFHDEEKQNRRFIVYARDEENKMNKVVQDISASIVKSFLVSHIDTTNIIQAVAVDGSNIELYSCGPLVSHHITIMAQWHDWGNETLWLGIPREDWDVENEEEQIVQKKSILLIDIDNPEKDDKDRGKNPHKNYISGISNEWKISLKIQERIYPDIKVCMHVFEDPAIPMYQNFWMFGIDNYKLASQKKVSRGDEVMIKFQRRN